MTMLRHAAPGITHPLQAHKAAGSSVPSHWRTSSSWGSTSWQRHAHAIASQQLFDPIDHAGPIALRSQEFPVQLPVFSAMKEGTVTGANSALKCTPARGIFPLKGLTRGNAPLLKGVHYAQAHDDDHGARESVCLRRVFTAALFLCPLREHVQIRQKPSAIVRSTNCSMP